MYVHYKVSEDFSYFYLKHLEEKNTFLMIHIFKITFLIPFKIIEIHRVTPKPDLINAEISGTDFLWAIISPLIHRRWKEST